MASNWQAASNGGGPRHWFVIRNGGREVASDAHGDYRRFASYAAADRAADTLNGAVPA